MKKTLALVLIFVFVLTFLSACGKKGLKGTYRCSNEGIGIKPYVATLTFKDGIVTFTEIDAQSKKTLMSWYAVYEHKEGDCDILVKMQGNHFYMYYDPVKNTITYKGDIYTK